MLLHNINHKHIEMSQKLVKRTLTDALGMKTFSLCRVPHTLRAIQMAQRAADSRRLLMALRADTVNGFVNIMTTDES